MRTISTSLLAAQKAADHVPYVRVIATNRLTDVVRLMWERLYTGIEDNYYHAVAVAGDGSLLRVRVGPPGDNLKLYYQRVAAPGPQSNFSGWTYTGQYGCQAVAVAACGATVSIFWVNVDREIYCLRSTDNGVTWSTPELLDYAANPSVTGMTAACKSNGDISIFFVNENTLYVKKCIGGEWQDKSTWDKDTGNLTSVAAIHEGDWDLLVSGQDTSGNYRVWSLIYGDGGEVSAGEWSALVEFAGAPSGGEYEYGSLCLDRSDVCRAFFLEKFSGAVSYNRPYWSHAVYGTDFSEGLWREPVPFDLDCNFGVAITHDENYCWLSVPDGVWRAPLTLVQLDLTDDVTAVRMKIRAEGGELVVELNNNDGKYNSPGTGALSVLKPGCQLEVSPGYVTKEGNEVSPGPAYWLTACEHFVSGGKSTLLLHPVDGWHLLSDWQAPHQLRWNKDASQYSVKQILAFILARVGLRLEVKSESSVVTGFCPDFTVHPGDSGIVVVRRLLSFVPDLLFIEGSTAFLVNPVPADLAVYSFDQSHAVIEGRSRVGVWQVNRLQAAGIDSETGFPLSIDSFEWQQIEYFPDRIECIFDSNLSGVSQAETRAQSHLRKSSISSTSGKILVPVSCGQQLWDVVEVTDFRIGLSSTLRRIGALELVYRPGKGEYFQLITLTGV